MKDLLIAALFMAAGRYTDMPIWELVACLGFAYAGATLIQKVKEEQS